MKTFTQRVDEVTQNHRFLTGEQESDLYDIWGLIDSETKIDIQVLFDKVNTLCNVLDWTACVLETYLSDRCAGQEYEALKTKRKAVLIIWSLLGNIYAACKPAMEREIDETAVRGWGKSVKAAVNAILDRNPPAVPDSSIASDFADRSGSDSSSAATGPGSLPSISMC
jgi:hypothetical protein